MTPLVLKAVTTMAIKHGTKLDDNGVPYLAHPMRVAIRAQEECKRLGGSEEQQEVVFIAGLLHDTVEDTDYTLEEIAVDFSLLISETVDGVSRREVDGKKEVYMDFIKRANENVLSRIVKRSDLEDNLMPERLDQLPEGKRKMCLQRYGRALELIHNVVSQ